MLASMNLSNPLRLITPTLEGEVLTVLARADHEFTGREVQRAVGASQDAVRLALRRLDTQGIVQSRPAGRAILFSLNRDHLAAPLIKSLATLRQDLFDRLRELIAGWQIAPGAAAVFGSVARNESDEQSDLDLFVLRPAGVEVDDPAWRDQLHLLQEKASVWTGNDARILEFGEAELADLAGEEPVLASIAREGIVLAGSLAALRPAERRASA